MTTSSIDNELISNCTVRIIASEQPEGFGVFVAPNRVLTCAHILPTDGSSINIQWDDQRLPVQVMKPDEEVDLALLSVELANHPFLPLNVEIVSFARLYPLAGQKRKGRVIFTQTY